MLSDSEASRSESDSLPATEPSAGRRFTQGDSKKKDDNLDMGIDGRACPPKFEERRRARKFSSGEDISGCPPIYSHKAVMLSVTKHLSFMRFFTSFRMTANLLSVTCPTAAQWRVGHRLLVGYRLLARQCISYGSVIVHRLSVTCPTAAQWRVGYRLFVIKGGGGVLQKIFWGRYFTNPP